MRMRARRQTRLGVLVATLLAFVGSEIQVAIHETIVRHVLCAEHGGQLEDLPQAVASDTAPEKAIAGKSVRTAPASPRDHRACGLPASLTSGVTTVASAPVLHPAEVSFLDPQTPEGVPGRTGPPLLHQAPKLSPPRV